MHIRRIHVIVDSICKHTWNRQRLKNTVIFSCGVTSSQHATKASSKMFASDAVIERTNDIIKSEEDKRLYRGLVLANHLRVLLVSDSSTDKSAAAMNVSVGYLSDPDHLPGLAHFCEHMLFLGTEKFPNENDYSKFLSEHGGVSNAATYPDHTNFYFDILPEHLRPALERFSQFFLTPLFTESATGRELNAVNSEHEKNIPNDAWRLDQLDRHNCDNAHPYHKFGTGNKDTLETIPQGNGVNVREELLQFHRKWYSANIMSLAVLGKESLDELEAIVVDLFGDIENQNVSAAQWAEHPFSKEQMKTCVHVVPVKDVRSLNIVFPAPDLQKHYESLPAGYVSNLIGHEGPGSILAALKELGWSNNLVAGYRAPHRGTGFFGVSVDLTEDGLEHTDDIIRIFFQYFHLMKQAPPIYDYHSEQRDVATLQFRFKEKETPRLYISALASKLSEYPLEHVLCNQYTYTKWEPEIITDLLDNYFTPENIRMAVLAKKFQGTTDQKEPWYGTEYKRFNIPQETLNLWANCELNAALVLPPKNDFIAEDFNLYPQDKDISEHPTIIKDTPITRVWFKQDDKYLLPKTNLMFDFVSPLAYLDPINCNLTYMFTQLFRDALNQYAYAAELSGLKWDLSNTKYGLLLSVTGFNHKQHILLQKIVDEMCTFKVDPKRFAVYKEHYIRTLKNFSAEQPYQQAVYYLAILLAEHSWTKEELLAAMDYVTVEKVEAFIPQILSKMHIECFIHGNANKQKALDIVDIVENSVNAKVQMSPLLPRQLLLNRELKLEDGCNYIYGVQNGIHKSSCVEVYYQCGLQSKESNVLLDLFSHMLQEPCFDTLRTKQQLGYIVHSGLRRSNGVQGFRVIVQSEKHPEFVDECIEEFLQSVRKYLEDMPDEDFERHKESLAAKRLEKPKQLSSQSLIYWMEITSQQYHFDRANVEVEFLRTLAKQDVIQFYEQLIEANAVQRHKISVHVLSTAEGGAGAELVNNSNHFQDRDNIPLRINDVTVFKSAHGMHPLVQPYINITRKGNKCKL